MEQVLELAAELVEGAVEMDVTQAAHATADRVSAVFAESGQAFLNVLEQAHGAVPWWRWSQSACEKHGGDAETCGHEQRATRMLADVLFGLSGGFGTGGDNGINDGMGISGKVGKSGDVHGWGGVEDF